MSDLSSLLASVLGGGQSNAGDDIAERLAQLSSLIGDDDTPSSSSQGTNIIQASKVKSDTKPTTRIEKVLNLERDSAEYSKQNRDDEAYGLLSKLIRIGPSSTFATVLINYYNSLIKTERGEESEKIRDELTAIIRDKFHSTPQECEIYATKCRKEKKDYFKAILFYQISASLINSSTGIENSINCLQSCVLGMKLCVMELLEIHPNYSDAIRKYVIPSMHQMRMQIQGTQAPGKVKVCLVEAVCLHHIETCERLAGDQEAREETLKASVEMMKTRLGVEEAVKHHVYGGALNNLGTAYLMRQRPSEAMEMFSQAIDAKMKAEDFDTEAEKVEDVEMSVRALSQAEEMLQSIADE